MDKQRLGRYTRIRGQLRELIEDKSPNLQAAMATICAILHAKMPHHFWTGFYFVSEIGELHVGPYQGPVACQVLRGSGACLHAVQTRLPVVIPDVEAFAGHIACDPRSKSEIVLPILKDGIPIAVMDIDSNQYAQFSEADIEPLQQILELLNPLL